MSKALLVSMVLGRVTCLTWDDLFTPCDEDVDKIFRHVARLGVNN